MNDILKPLIMKFMPFAKKQMGFSRPPKLFLRNDTKNGGDPLGKTGFYDPHNESITLYTTNRHPKDIMRSLAHELMHHTQKCNGDFDNVGNVGEQGYAQSDPHMRTMEIQAYKASIVFRDWEDSLKETIYYEHLYKGDKKMSTKSWKNKELNGLLMERFGFGFKPLLEEEKEELEEMCPHEDEVDMMPDDEGDVGGGIEALAAAAMAAVEELSSAAGADISTDVEADDDMGMEIELIDDEELEERRGRGRVGPHTRGTPDPRLRETIKDMIRQALKAKGTE